MSRRSRENFDQELNLAPFIDVFVTLIVFMLLSTVFIRVSHLSVFSPGTSESPGLDRGVQVVAALGEATIEIKTYDLQNEERLNDLSFSGTFQSADDLKGYLVRLEPHRSAVRGVLLKGYSKGNVGKTLSVVESFRRFEPQIPVVLVTEVPQ